MNLIVNDQPAVRIAATVTAKSLKAYLLDCEGDPAWVPISLVTIEKDGTVLIVESFYNKLVEQGVL